MHTKLAGNTDHGRCYLETAAAFLLPHSAGDFFSSKCTIRWTPSIVGRAVGTQALAAVGSTAALINLINGFFIGLSTGASVLLSQFFGASNRRGVNEALHTGVALSVVLGVCHLSHRFFRQPVHAASDAHAGKNCLADAQQYVQIYFCGAVASMIYNMGSGILRAMGDSKRPLIFLIIACFVNIFADLLCVVGLKMGVAGAAVATVASQVVSAVLVLLVLRRLPSDIRLEIRSLKIQPQLLRRILYVGVPAGLQFITFDLANVLIQSGINSFGDVTIAAWTAYVKTDALTWQISGAFGVSITTFVGQNFGAQKYSRIRKKRLGSAWE